ncbi:hypothetical protein [Lunatibacter salilacus]|uniref:hypothetical protein n=1 Tax=Lunatibacter salilacus TaxID=2483804 RepID=UPI001F15E028|nr:hypothetical protein [Lunatibacter salilacus]
MKHRLIKESHCIALLKQVGVSGWREEYQPEKHQIEYTLPGGERLFVRLPIQVAFPYRPIHQDNMLYQHIIILIESGLAAVGYFENGENIDHKVFRAYMVRKKQGKSQIKYLKTKGKSRAGSRVRLAETMEFFTSIRERVNSYIDTNRIDRIAISCSLTLWPYFFGGKGDLLFSKNDPRVYKVPMHVPDCTYDNLLKVNDFLMQGELKYSPEINKQIESIYHIESDTDDTDKSEEW